MSACNAQAESQVGCRLMVASSANTSRPRLPPVAAGPSPRTRSMKASISGREEAGAGGCGSLLMAGILHRNHAACASRQDTRQYMTARVIGDNNRCILDYVVDLERLVHDRIPL